MLKSALPFLENVLMAKHVLIRGVGGIVSPLQVVFTVRMFDAPC